MLNDQIVVATFGRNTITAQSGAQFDPALVGVFVECYRDMELDRVAIDEIVARGKEEPGEEPRVPTR